MESFSPQGRRAPLPFSMCLHEGASPRPRRGAMAALCLGAPFTTMVTPYSEGSRSTTTTSSLTLRVFTKGVLRPTMVVYEFSCYHFHHQTSYL